jgi:hypothetical protein
LNIYEKSLNDLCTNLQITKSDKEYYKFEKLITVVNQAYLKIVLKEFNYIKNKNTEKEIESNFSFLMSLYNKHLREHQVMFLLFNIFETAVRSKAVIELSLKYSSNGNDDWLHNSSLTPNKIIRPLQEAKNKIIQDGEDINN